MYVLRETKMKTLWGPTKHTKSEVALGASTILPHMRELEAMISLPPYSYISVIKSR